ncbi:MAG: aminoacyl-histidine dipeptidase [Candidatus Palauibacterales bacterium]|nr:aminoacyl-histidine dipeptidase [Candidatus Palauibacterales bacterium]MDP2482501.1 aminoacyl-histidine dipeptidase [Candidatus Palauibacterales bacterium]
MTFVSELQPTSVWHYFDQLLAIPRGSKKEEKARAFVTSVAERLGLDYTVDETGNVIVRKPATGGDGSGSSTILQSHLDMVQEKNSDVEFDFDRDAIRPVLDGEYLKADGTTLGSDNGIGVATMLALMEARDLTHGPLEFLFTIDEETGLTGAGGLDEGLLEGRMLINLDSEEEGVLTIGCAGGADTHLHLAVERSAVPKEHLAIAINVAGLRGGHSGVDIHLQRGNAIKIVARALHAASLAEPVRVASFEGGNAHNAIPREASAVVVFPDAEDIPRVVRETLESELKAARAELGAVDPGMTYSIVDASPPTEALGVSDSRRLLSLVTALPHGVLAMSNEIEGLVETSTNLAVIREREGRVFVLMSSRSSVMSALAALRQRIRSFAYLSGSDLEEKDGYPAWQPDVNSPLLKVVRQVHERIAGEAEVGAVHAGLECGIVGEKYPGMDMISFGPQIEFPHSPDERVKVASVGEFYEVVKAVLEELAGA